MQKDLSLNAPGCLACRQYENEIGINGKARRDTQVQAQVQFNIYGGMQSEQGEFPYMVALGYENEDRNDDDSEAVKYNCGGTLISSQYILTAAHCVSNIQERVPIEVMTSSKANRFISTISIIEISALSFRFERKTSKLEEIKFA